MTEFLNYVGGEWIPSTSGMTYVKTNPANTDEVIGSFQLSNEEDARIACAAASAAATGWAKRPAPQRGEFLFRAAELLQDRLDSVAREMTREEGKTLPEAQGEVRRAINILRYFGGEGSRHIGQNIPSERDGVFAYTTRRALGVVALITPWNFPISIPTWKLAPALIAGNTVVLKPAEQAPLSSLRLIEALHDAGLPSGVVNYVTGNGATVGNAIVENPALKAISFTGSCAVGGRIHHKVSGRRLRVQLEMGGKNPTIVLKDADLDAAANILVNGAFFSTGQKCTACSRAIIERPVYDALVAKLVARTKALKIGDGLEPGTDIGPAIDEAQMENSLKHIEIARSEGAELLLGGHRLAGPGYDNGYFVAPTIFTGVKPEMRLAQEEVFGPVLALIVAEDFDDAIRLANGVDFGLSASIVSNDLKRVYEFIERIEAGVVSVNMPSAGIEYQFPFGGTKNSSFGLREQGPTALDFYTESKTVYLKFS